MTSPPRYAVFGQPIAHSLSPRIHAMFAVGLGIALDYRAIEAGRDDFAGALDAFARDGGAGANVTLPLKQDAAALCAGVSDRARRCGSVNTLIRERDHWQGDSTDGVGLLCDLERQAFDACARRCVLLGAGGAARAVAFALADAGAGEIVIANRTHARARALADAIGDRARVVAIEWSRLDDAGAFDLIVHATAAGHDGTPLALPASLAKAHTLGYDLSYGRAATPFLGWAHAVGLSRVADGLGMLVEQAAESFAIWHGRRPETMPVFETLRREHPLAVGGT